MRNWLVACCVAASFHATAAPADDIELEHHVTAVAEQLRCLACQNQTVADSHADLAADLRNQIRAQIRAGQSDQQIFDFMTARYGDFVLYRPRITAATWLLWFGPFAVLLAGLVLLFRRLRATPPDNEVPDTDRQTGID